MIGRQRHANFLQKSGLSRLGGGDDKASLTLTDGGDEIEDAHAERSAEDLQVEALMGIYGGFLKKLKSGLRPPMMVVSPQDSFYCIWIPFDGAQSKSYS